MKIPFGLILLLLFLIIHPDISNSQQKDSLSAKKDSVPRKTKTVVKKKSPPKKIIEESFMDKVQKILEIRRSFDISDQITKPALLSLKKENDEKTVFSIDMGIAYKGFRYDVAGVTPSLQFDYSSKSKDQKENIKAGFVTYYKFYQYKGGSGKVSPSVFFSKDFYSKVEELTLNLTFVPRFPDFFIPIRNVSEIKFKYDGNDNRWVFGINPVLGATFERLYGGNNHINRTEYYSVTAVSLTLKRYYFQFDVYGKYEKEFIAEHSIRYKYESTMTFYFDLRERSSVNFKFEQSEREFKRTRRLTIGFGIKL